MQLVPRSALSPCRAGSSGSVRAVVLCKKRAAELLLELCLLQMWGEQSLPGEGGPALSEAYQEREELCSSAAPKPWSVIQLALPTRQHHKPRELQLQSTKQPGSGQLGRASGPGRTYYSSP